MDLKTDEAQLGTIPGGSGTPPATGDSLLRSAELYYKVQNKPGFPGCLPNLAANGKPVTLWAGGVPRSVIESGFLVLPGKTGNYASTPTAPKYTVTTKLEVRVQVLLDSYEAPDPVANVLISKLGSNRDWDLGFLNRILQLVYVNGTGAHVASSTSKIQVTPNPIWIGFSVDCPTGQLKFWQGTDENALRQVGSTIILETPTTITNADGAIYLGTWNGFQYNPPGRYYQAKVVVDGVLQAHFKGNSVNTDTLQATAPTGETWTVVRSTTTNDPKYLPFQGKKYVYIPPSSSGGNNLFKTNSGANSVVGDIDIRCRLDRTDLTANPCEMGELVGSSGSTGWIFRVENNQLRFAIWTTAGLMNKLVADPGTKYPWYRATRIASTGVISFYTSLDGLNWSLVQSFTDAVGNVAPGTGPTKLAGNASEGVKYYYWEVRNGINGSVVESWSADNFNGWLIARAGANSYNAVFVEDADCYLFGIDDVFTTDAVYPNYQIALNDSFSAVFVSRRWFDAVSWYQHLFGNHAAGAVPGPGWSISHDSADFGRIKGTSGQTEARGTSILGTKSVLILVRDRSVSSSPILRLYQNKTLAATIAEVTPDEPANQNQLFLGNIFSTQPMGAEFFEAAFYRSVLTQEGINQIVDSIIPPVAGTGYVVGSGNRARTFPEKPGLTVSEASLTPYTGPKSFNSGTVTISNALITGTQLTMPTGSTAILVLRNCKLRISDIRQILAQEPSKVDIQHCLFDGFLQSNESTIAMDYGGTVRYCEFMNCPNPFRVGPNSTVEWNYIHAFPATTTEGGAHSDGVECYYGTRNAQSPAAPAPHIFIRNNYIDIKDAEGATGNVNLTNDFGIIDGVDVDGNWFMPGGTYSLYVRDDGLNSANYGDNINIRVRNNRWFADATFRWGGFFGTWSNVGPGLTEWTNNILVRADGTEFVTSAAVNQP